MTIDNKEQTNEVIETTQTIAAVDAETKSSELSAEEADQASGGGLGFGRA
jgi:hypothetical protein